MAFFIDVKKNRKGISEKLIGYGTKKGYWNEGGDRKGKEGKEVKQIVEKPEKIELVITGRGASPRVIKVADLVTEMKMVKHYFEKGIQARVGIEM